MNQLLIDECPHDYLSISTFCRECSKCGLVQEFTHPYGWLTIPPSNAKEVKASHIVGGMYIPEDEKKKVKKEIKKNL